MLYIASGFISVATFLSLFVVGRLYRALRLQHPAVYAELGSPTVFRKRGRKENPDPYDTLLLRFVYAKRHQALDDVRVRRLGDFLYWFWPFCVVVLVLLFMLSVASMVFRYAT
ncbi:hypothetical protein [Thioalkalivibrio paradoxus]|uniref:Universal stress protein B n=1 Tax=Thioalkalivibrio paradoxus ARh 1 TaxID=713585 RepID=W0DTT7_9GAMM|nr:hypothetical protein [Thioalkalivibrio paradoxus]AHF00286.1 hypothetical protein THITH_15475 [Thioalkalivibrio paradoxus ARh 1]